MGKVVIGVDPHKRLNAVVVVDARGKVLARQQLANSAGGVPGVAFVRSPVASSDLGDRGLQRCGQAPRPTAGGRR